MGRNKRRKVPDRRRVLRTELLESRLLLANDIPFQNPGQALDVNRDLNVSALDALEVINFVGRAGPDPMLPSANTGSSFPDVDGNGNVTALDALRIINKLDPSNQPILAARIVTDSGPSSQQNLDFITNRYSLEFGVTHGDGTQQLEIRIDGAGSDPFVTVGDPLGTTALLLDEAQLDSVAGSPLTDGDHRIEIRVSGQSNVEEFIVTIDKTAPQVAASPPDLVRRAISALTVGFSDNMGIADGAFDLANYSMSIVGGANDGQNVPVTDVTQIDSATARITFEQSLAEQTYRLAIENQVTDPAGNSLAGSTTFDFGVDIVHTSFEVAAQNPVRNSPDTGFNGMADQQDGAFVNLSPTVGGFMWQAEVLPAVAGRNGLTPDWTLYTNSRAHSRGGLFGTTPATLESFERMRRGSSGELIYQEKQVREFVFDLQPTAGTPAGGDPRSPEGATARARYEIVWETETEILMRRPDGTRLTFFPLDGTPTAGALRSIQNRFGDTIDHEYDESGSLRTVTGVRGRQWTFSYDDSGKLSEIREDANTLRDRYVQFSYDAHGRLIRIDTTSVNEVGGTDNEFPEGKPIVLTYPEVTGDLSRDTNIASVIASNQVLDDTNTPRMTNVFGTDDRLIMQKWGGMNTSQVLAGGDVLFEYGETTTTVTDRNGNQTQYSFNDRGLAIEIEEFTNRDIRGGDDPDSYVTTYEYNDDEEVTRLTQPLGNQLRSTFDTSNVDRFAHGNLSELRQVADLARGADGQGTAIADIVHTFHYERIYQLPRIVTKGNGNDGSFVPPIPDNEANVQDLDFNLDGDTNDEADGESLRARRYSTYSIYDYQEGSSADIQSLAQKEFVTVTPAQAAALSLQNDLNLDGLTNQQVGRPIEVRSPNVTLEDGSVQLIRRNFQWNAFAQLSAEIDPEGYVDEYSYYAENAPSRLGQPITPNPPGRSLSPSTGGYLQSVVRDNGTLIRLPADMAPRAESTTRYKYDNVGNPIEIQDPRGIKHTRVVNERNQVQVSIAAADTSDLNAEEPRPLTELHYETNTFFDGNDNVILVQKENVVDQGGGNHQRVAGNPWLDTSFVYDLLDNVVARTEEISAGESRSIRGHDLPVGPTESITTHFRHDRNENLVLRVSPRAVEGTQPNNVTSTIFDERDLPSSVSAGGTAAQFSEVAANADLTLPMGVGNTGVTSTSRILYDGNRNVRMTIDAEDNGSSHDGTAGLLDTDDPTVNGIQRGDPIVTTRDGFDRVLTVTDAKGLQSANGCSCGGGEFAYDPDGQLLIRSSIGPEGGNLRGGNESDRLLSQEQYFYDEGSRLYGTEVARFDKPQPLDAPVVDEVHAWRTLYDRSSRIKKETRPLGDFTEHDYDGLDRTIARRSNPMSGPAGTFVPSEEHFLYDDASNLVQVKEIERSVADGRSETFFRDMFYDAYGRAELAISPHFENFDANATRTEFDSRSNVVAQLDANASTSVPITVDRDGPLTLAINSTGNAVISVHDGLGRVVQTVRELRIGHDAANGLDLSNPHNNDGLIVTLNDWDENSRIVATTDDPDTSQPTSPQNPSTTQYGYDDLNRLTTQTNADGETKHFGYDRDSNLVGSRDENGSVFTYTFDDINRVTQIDIAPAEGVEGTTQQAFEYDGLSRIVVSRDNNGEGVDSTVERSYDSLSRVRQDRQQYGQKDESVFLDYDLNSNVTRLTFPNGRQVTFGYQDTEGHTLNRLELIEEGSGTGDGSAIVPTRDAVKRIAEYAYIGPGRVASRKYGNATDGDGVLAEYRYDEIRRQSEVEHSLPSLGGSFIHVESSFDKAGNRLNEIFHHEGVQDAYGFDSAGRLIGEVRGAAIGAVSNNQAQNPNVTSDENRSWNLDGSNNWQSVTAENMRSISAQPNEMNEYDAVTFSGEEGGNGTFDFEYDANGNLISDGRREYVYDAFNRLVRVKDAFDQDDARYGYDALGRRVERKTFGAFEQTFSYFYFGERVIEEELSSFFGSSLYQYVWGDTVWGDELLQYRARSETLYIHENTYGSILRTTTDAGAMRDVFDYNAYGEFSKTGITTILPYAFRGMRFDSETRFYLIGNGAYFNAGLGRTISRGSGALLNLYAWGGNHLLNGLQPGGTKAPEGQQGCAPRLQFHVKGLADWRKVAGFSHTDNRGSTYSRTITKSEHWMQEAVFNFSCQQGNVVNVTKRVKTPVFTGNLSNIEQRTGPFGGRNATGRSFGRESQRYTNIKHVVADGGSGTCDNGSSGLVVTFEVLWEEKEIRTSFSIQTPVVGYNSGSYSAGYASFGAGVTPGVGGFTGSNPGALIWATFLVCCNSDNSDFYAKRLDAPAMDMAGSFTRLQYRADRSSAARGAINGSMHR